VRVKERTRVELEELVRRERGRLGQRTLCRKSSNEVVAGSTTERRKSPAKPEEAVR
jgi:hypothetical protein